MEAATHIGRRYPPPPVRSPWADHYARASLRGCMQTRRATGRSARSPCTYVSTSTYVITLGLGAVLYALPHLDDGEARELHAVLDVAHRLEGEPDHACDDDVKGGGGRVQEQRRRSDPVRDHEPADEAVVDQVTHLVRTRVRDRVRDRVRFRVRDRLSLRV